MLKLTTAGESHGKGLFAILEGIPSGLNVRVEEINKYLALRQSGYGRGGRQKIESDRVEILSGVCGGVTLGSPIALAVHNRDYQSWEPYMAAEGCDLTQKRLTKVRPGHADYTGMKKFSFTDARNVLERASARETAIRVAAGTLCRALIREVDVEVTGYVRSVCDVEDTSEYSFGQIQSGRGEALFMMDKKTERDAMDKIDALKAAGDTCGGIIELRVKNLKSGFGSCMTYREKLDARLTSALMSIQAVKGVEIGLGFCAARLAGSKVHDEMFLSDGKVFRKTNGAGGIEGGMSNGEEIVIRLAMKPIPTLMKGLNTIDTDTLNAAIAAAERSDVCAIVACEVIAESVLCTELCSVILERLGGDTLAQVKERYGRIEA